MDDLILSALTNKKLINFVYDGKFRTCEPHVFGLANGVKQVLCWQISGGSSRPMPPNWRRFDLKSIDQLKVLDETFDGKRDIPSGAHSIWDRVVATV